MAFHRLIGGNQVVYRWCHQRVACRFEVVTCNEAIENAAQLWSAEGAEMRARQQEVCQVVVGSSEVGHGYSMAIAWLYRAFKCF